MYKRQLQGRAVELLRLHRIHLVEGQGRNPVADLPDIVRDIPRPVEIHHLPAQNHIGFLLIHIERNAGHPRNRPKALHKRLPVGQRVAVNHQTHHDLPGLKAHPDQRMANKPPVILLIVGLNVKFFHIILDHPQDIPVYLGPQQAVLLLHNGVGAARVKTGDNPVSYSHLDVYKRQHYSSP